MLPWPNDKEPLEALQHDMFLKLFASSTGKKALPDHLPVVIILSVNETAHRVCKLWFPHLFTHYCGPAWRTTSLRVKGVLKML